MSFHTWCGTFPVAVTKTPNKSNLREEGFPWLTAQGHSPSGWGKHGGRNVRLLTLHSQLEVNAGAQLTFSVFSVTQQHPWDDAVTHFRVSLLLQLTQSRNFLIDMPEASLLNDSRARQVGKINITPGLQVFIVDRGCLPPVGQHDRPRKTTCVHTAAGIDLSLAEQLFLMEGKLRSIESQALG